MPLTKEEQDTLDALTKKATEPDPPPSAAHSRVDNINVTIDLDNPEQVKRAVKSGLLPASYLEDDEDDDEDDDKPDADDPPRRTLDRRFS